MAATDKKRAAEVQSQVELVNSLEAFRKKVDENYRAFFNESPSVADEKRSLFHLWMHRSAGAEHTRKKR